MKQLVHHIQEKLKISSTYRSITFDDLYNLLDTYCKETGNMYLAMHKIYGHKVSTLPKIKINNVEYPVLKLSRSMNGGVKNIIPEYFKSPGMTSCEYIRQNDGTPVEFLTEDDLNKIIEYMQDEIDK